MRIDARDRDRIAIGHITGIDLADPPAQGALTPGSKEVTLQWDDTTLDNEHHTLRGCPVCGCREIFRRRDFPQRFGLTLVIVAAVGSIVLFAYGQVLWSVGVLIGAVIVDRIAGAFTGECLVCYRCRSEFRDMPITEAHEPWELAIGEKYRPVRQRAEQTGSTGPTSTGDATSS